MRNVVSTILFTLFAVILWTIYGVFKLLQFILEPLVHIWNANVWRMHDVANVVTNNGCNKLHDVFSYPEEICGNVMNFYVEGGNIEKLKRLSQRNEIFCGTLAIFVLYAIPAFSHYTGLEMNTITNIIWLAIAGYFAYFYIVYRRIQAFVSEIMQVA
ncbi:hypothetical protein [Bacillus mycoides]|uniref:Uncharacterized protein n=1 Tax=Bacillus mycoides TaxID=1405 RepID=A0ABC9QVT2_BACMY|nr:hypothetical protein [Bacillus mycoides]EJR29147.1 hypothetical protein III_05952 [Bacillus mycoides]